MRYVQGLPDFSLTEAHMHGGRQFYGWGQDRHILADIYDGLMFNAEATGQYTKPPSFPRWPRPKKKDAETEKKQPVSVRSMWARLKGQQARN